MTLNINQLYYIIEQSRVMQCLKIVKKNKNGIDMNTENALL